MAAVLLHKFFTGYRVNPRSGIFISAHGTGRAHLQQGELDGACGIYCVVMGLIACKEISVREGNNLATSHKKLLRDFWQNIAPFFFIGSRGIDLWPLLEKSFPGVHIRHIALDSEPLIDRLIGAIGKNVFVMIRVANWEADYDHWVVLSGAEGIQESRRFLPLALLVLDPAYPAPLHRLYNGILQIERGRKAHRYFQEGEKKDVYILEALSFDSRGAL